MQSNIEMTGDEESLIKCIEEIKKTTDNLVVEYPVVLEKRSFKLYKINQKPFKNFKGLKR